MHSTGDGSVGGRAARLLPITAWRWEKHYESWFRMTSRSRFQKSLAKLKTMGLKCVRWLSERGSELASRQQAEFWTDRTSPYNRDVAMTDQKKRRRQRLEEFVAQNPKDTFSRYGLALECLREGEKAGAERISHAD